MAEATATLTILYLLLPRLLLRPSARRILQNSVYPAQMQFITMILAEQKEIYSSNAHQLRYAKTLNVSTIVLQMPQNNV